MASKFSAGLMWVLNLGFLALDQRALSLTKLMWWMWIAYLAIGIKMTLAHRHSPSILYLQSVYFLTYATMGFLWHCREMHLRSLWLSKLDRESSAYINQGAVTAASPATCPQCDSKLNGDRMPDDASTKTATTSTTAAGSHYGCRPQEWLSARRVAVVGMCCMVQYIVYRAWLLTTCEEKDQLVCLFRLLYAIMLAVWRERDVEMGCWQSPGVEDLQKESTPAAVMPKQATATTIAGEYSIVERVLNLDVFGWGNATMLTKLIFWMHYQSLIIVLTTPFLYWHLPREQWLYTVQAVLYAWYATQTFCDDIYSFKAAHGKGMY
ncbi:g7657 [Coccomyxa viridis]|uniref:G7657 protein n=1 Tax=Coccomyxa viridis TaxID=1274662 RepID=A0ABP1FYF9_9CHLO